MWLSSYQIGECRLELCVKPQAHRLLISIRNYMSKDWFAQALKAQEPSELWGLIQDGLVKTKPQKEPSAGSGVMSSVVTANGIATSSV